MTRIDTVVNHYLFVGGPADGQRIAVENDREMVYIDKPPKINYDASLANQKVEVFEIETHEYLKRRHIGHGFVYVYRDTLDAWEFE